MITLPPPLATILLNKCVIGISSNKELPSLNLYKLHKRRWWRHTVVNGYGKNNDRGNSKHICQKKWPKLHPKVIFANFPLPPYSSGICLYAHGQWLTSYYYYTPHPWSCEILLWFYGPFRIIILSLGIQHFTDQFAITRAEKCKISTLSSANTW